MVPVEAVPYGRLDTTCKPGCAELSSQPIPGAVITWFDGDTHSTMAQHWVKIMKVSVVKAQTNAA